MKNIILGLILLLGSESVFSEPDFSGPDFSEEEYIAIEEHYFSVLDDVFDVDRFSDGGFTFRFTQDMYRSILERQSHIDFDSMLVIVPKDKSIYDQVFNYYRSKRKLLPANEIKLSKEKVALNSCKKLEAEYWGIYQTIADQILSIRRSNQDILSEKRAGRVVLDIGDRHPPIYELWYADYPQPEIYVRSTARDGLLAKLENRLIESFEACRSK